MSGCSGSGGSVFTCEGPQFGAHIEEEPCERCGGWHESPGERESRLRWENRRRPIRDLIRRLRPRVPSTSEGEGA